MDVDALAEDDLPEDRNLREDRQRARGKERGYRLREGGARKAPPEHAGNSGAEDGQDQAGDGLVSAQRHRHERIDERSRAPRKACREDRKQRVPGFERCQEAERRAHQHHALDAEVEVPGFFT